MWDEYDYGYDPEDFIDYGYLYEHDIWPNSNDGTPIKDMTLSHLKGASLWINRQTGSCLGGYGMEFKAKLNAEVSRRMPFYDFTVPF